MYAKVTGQGNDAEDTFDLAEEDFKLSCESTVLNVGTYTIRATVDSDNYDPKVAEADFEITPATIKSLTFEPDSLVYHAKAYEPKEDLKDFAKVTAQGNEGEDPFEVDAEDFKLSCESTVLNVGTYTIKVNTNSDNYADSDTAVTADFKITPATIVSLTFNPNSRVFRGKAYDPDRDLKEFAEVTAQGNEGENPFVVDNKEEVTLSCDSENGILNGILYVDTYTIQANTKSDNYVDSDKAVTADFKITPATIISLAFEPDNRVYDREEHDPGKDGDIKGKATLTATANTEDETFEVDESLYKLTCGETIRNVKTYTITAVPDETNFIEKTVEQFYSITYLQVSPINITIKGAEGTNRLGGPDESKYHSFTVTGEQDEPMTITVSDGTNTLTITGDTEVTVNITGDAISFNGQTLKLDTSGDTEYTITANYDDCDNLKTGDEEKAAEAVSATFFYDVAIKNLVFSRQLMNRGENSVQITAPEAYAQVVITAAGENSFTATAKDVKIGTTEVSFDNGLTNAKLFSTTHSSGNTYSAEFTDLVGNVGTVTGGTIAQCSGNLTINSVTPAPNGNGWIGLTPNLTWSITMTTTYTHNELVNLSVGKTFSQDMQQGENSMDINPNQLTADTKLTVSATFDDLIGSASFTSIGYDYKADMPVLTTPLYDGCNILAGIAEPSRRVTISVNGEAVTTNSDRWGVFVTDKLPLAYEGDEVVVRYTDKADNFISMTRTVGEADDLVEMDAFMLGRVRTDSHERDYSETPGWTNMLNVTTETLQAGQVKLPIIAGNVVQVGEITLSMDANNVVSYSYTLNEGIELVGEGEVTLIDSRSMEDALQMTGTKISENGTTINAQRGKNPTYTFVGKFQVKVPTEELESTFQTADQAEDALKQMYVDRQVRPL